MLLGSVIGCAQPGPPAVPTDPAAHEEAIARLESSIARDRQTLEGWVARPRDEATTELHDDPVMREIAARLAADHAFLERIRQSQALLPAQSPLPPPAILP